MTFSQVFEERGREKGRGEGAGETQKKIAIEMLKDGELSIEKIAQYSELSINTIKELKADLDS